MAYVLKINCKPIMYIFFFELARFIGIKSSFDIYSDGSCDFYSGVMSHDPPQIHPPEKLTLKPRNDTKSVYFSVHCICCTINSLNTVNG